MQYLGDFVSGATVRGGFNTRKSDGTPITLAGTPALSVYKDGNTTETTTGVTLTVDFDSRTGHHLFAIDTSDAFFSSGSDFRIVITTGTVDSVSVVGVQVGSFSLLNRSALRPTVAGRTLSVEGTGNVRVDGDAFGDALVISNLATETTSLAIKAKTDLITSTTNFITVERVAGSTITMYYNEATTATVGLDENTSSMTLRFVVENSDQLDVLVIENANITRTASNFTVTITTAVTATLGQYRWALRDITGGVNRLIEGGVLQVVGAANKDA